MQFTADVRSRLSMTSMQRRPLIAMVMACAIGAGAIAEVEPSTSTSVPTTQPRQAGAAGDDVETPQVDGLATEESIARFQQLLQRRPFHGPAFTGLVNHYLERGKLTELIAEYTARAEALPDDVPVRIVLARLLLRAGDADKAAAIVENLKQLPPELSRLNSELLVFKSEVFQRTGDHQAAEQMLLEAQKQARSVSEQLKLGEALADLYLRDKRSDDAVASLRSLAAQFPDQYLHQRHIADALAQRSLFEPAVEQYRGMLPLVRDQTDKRCEVLRQLGMSLERLGRRDEAIEVYAEAIGLLASDHWLQRELHERIVSLYRASGRLEDLVEYCRAQIARAPEQIAMRLLLADVQAAMDQAQAASQTLTDAVELFPSDLTLSLKRLELLERSGDAEGVLAEYQRIIGRHPDDAELYIAYGQFLAGNRQVEAARDQWRHVLATQVSDAALAMRLSGLFEAHELYDDAVETYERAVMLAPQQPEAYLALARLWQSRDNKDKAIDAIARARKANPNDGSVHAATAQAFVNLGDTDTALEAIARACELAPDEVRYRQLHAELLVHSGRLEEALQVRRRTVDLMTNPVQQTEAINVMVSMHASTNRLAALKADEERRLAEKASDAVSLLILARVADTERDFRAARQRLDELLQIDPANEIALQSLAKLQDATGDVDEAVRVWQRLIELHPARSRPFYEAIVDLKLRYGDRAGGIETLERMVRDDPGSVGVINAVAEQLVRMGEQERAVAFYEQSLQLQPDRHEIRLDYGKALVEAGRLDDALREFRTVATQRADTDRALEALARLHDTATQLGVLEELIDELQRLVEADPQNTTVARALAQLLVREYEYGRAMDLLDLVLRHNPRDVELALARAELNRRLARFDDAIAGYQQILRFPQIDRDFVLGELGKAYFESGQVDQARRLWKQIQHKLYAGSLLKNNGLLNEAVVVFEEGIRLRPDDYALHRNLIVTLEAAGKTDEALKAARRLLDLEPGNVSNIEQLARAYERNGDRAGSAEVAARLFSAGVGTEKPGAGGTSAYSLAGAMHQSMSAQYGGSYYYSGRATRSSLDRGIEFFRESHLLAELDEVLQAQIAAQPPDTAGGAVLREAAADLYMTELGKPELALTLLRELETATFPIEHQSWLGQCSQRDFMRVRQYNLIASKPALRDARLAELEKQKADELGRDDALELAIIRNAQGNTDEAIDLLQRAIRADEQDLLARGILVDLLIAAERFADAEPHARRLVNQLAVQRDQLRAQMIDRVRRDFVRGLPLEHQLRVTEALLADIADKWTLGQGFTSWLTGTVRTMGYLRAQLSLATILAETDRVAEARAVWQELAPSADAPDVDNWTMLASVAQLHDQDDFAYEFYQQALRSAKVLAGDPLLQQVYGTGIARASWYGEMEGVDSAFNKIVEAFAKRDSLIELCDFLRDTDQDAKARLIAEQYKLDDRLRDLYERRVTDAAAEFKQGGGDDALDRSVGYFAQVCKLAEVHDRSGRWNEAQQAYEQYLADFPDELGLLGMLGEAAETQRETDQAIAWEKKVLECKSRLTRRARQWAMRDLTLTPARPQVLGAAHNDPWGWANRWGRNRWSYGSVRDQLERSPSWMRLANLYLADDNAVAAADAMQHAVAEASSDRNAVIRQVLELIQQRQLTTKVLPVVRSLAVSAPSEERVQLAFAEALEGNQQKDVAGEVYKRMLRRGVSDLGVLAQVQRKLQALHPDAAPPEATLASLAAEVAADPSNLKNRLRLARAYFYSLDVDRALEVLVPLVEEAPHLEDVHSLLVEAYTLKGNSDKLIEALTTQISRIADDDLRRAARWRLVNELMAAGRYDEALVLVKELGDPREPWSFQRISGLLHYFGRHDDALACLAQAGRSQARNPWDEDGSEFAMARSLVLKGDHKLTTEKILAAVDSQLRQQVQYGGMYGLYNDQINQFAPLKSVFTLHPELAEEVRGQVEQRHAADPNDPQATRLLMQIHRTLGRPDLADALLDQMGGKGASDQNVIAQLIDRAMKRREYDKAISLAESFIAQQPKPQIPPGVPPQHAAMMVMQSPRVFMTCKLGDVYWERNQPEKAFETYRQIVDEKVDQTRIAYASICLVRGRMDEARTLVDEELAAQPVKSPVLLQFRAFIAAIDGQNEKVFDLLAESAAPGAEQQNMMGMYGEFGGASPLGSLAAIARQAGLIDRFVQFMRQRIEKNPHDWENYETLATTLMNSGRSEDALTVLGQAQQVTSLTLQALKQRAEWRESVALVQELIPLYERLVDLSERDVGSNAQQQAMYRYRMGSYGGGGESAGQTWRNRLGGLQWDNGERDKALSTWTGRMNEQQSGTHIKLGQMYLEREAFDLAQQAFAKALELDPDNATAHLALADLAYYDAARNERLKGETQPIGGPAGLSPQSSALMNHMIEAFNREFDSGSSSSGRSRGSAWYDGLITDQRMTVWAVEINRLLRDEKTASERLGAPGTGLPHAANGDVDGSQARLMLAMLTGDWATLESQLSSLMQRQTFDPLVWRMWGVTQQRKGNWAEAARAWEFLRRAKLTSIANHREQLRLVLAGKAIKEAAAGTRQSPTGSPATRLPGSQQMMYSGRYSSMMGMGEEVESETSQLAAIYIRLGRFAEAERLYLLSSGGGGIQWALPSLASLMWQQGARERGLELARLAVVLATENDSMVMQYAAMLADTGQVEKATELLTRAYRWENSDSDNPYAAMWGFARDAAQFEEGQESAYSRTLSDILRRTGTFEQTLAKLSAEAAANPSDSRLAKLVLSLQMQDRRWNDAQQSITAWLAARPDDSSLHAERLHVHFQLGQWDEALKTLTKLRAHAPDRVGPWCMNEAFIQLMRGDPAAAVMAIKPLLDEPITADPNTASSAVCMVLAAADREDLLRQYLETLRTRGMIDDAGLDLLARCLLLQGQYSEALQLVLQQYWKQQTVFDPTDRWHRALQRLVSAARAADVTLKPAADRPEDAALLALVTRGPQAGIEAFSVAAENTDGSTNVLRGLVLAATLAGDDPLALSANKRLIEWLESRRQEVWFADEAHDLQRTAQTALRQMRRSGTTSLVLSGAAGQMLQQAIQSLGGPQGSATYEELWRAHQRLQRDLLARGGDLGVLQSLLATQARTFQSVPGGYGDDMTSYWQMMGSMRPSYRSSSYSQTNPASADDELLRSGRRPLSWRILWRNARLDGLFDALESAEWRVPESEWSLAGEVCAAVDREDDAAAWLRRRVTVNLARLRAGDAPGLDASDSYAWRWSWYSGASQQVNSIRAALGVAVVDAEADVPDRSITRGRADEVWEIALIDPAVEQQLLACAKDVGAGWGSTQTLTQLIAYHRAKEQPESIIELMERAYAPDQLIRAAQLSDYVRACFKAGDWTRLERLLKEVSDVSSTLANDVAVTRLVILRRQNKSAEANELESSLLSRCVADRPNVHRPDPLLRDSAPLRPEESAGERHYSQYSSSFEYPFMPTGSYSNRSLEQAIRAREPSTAAMLAAALGVRYQSAVSRDDLTLARIRAAYERHGLFADAARLAGIEAAAATTVRERIGLLMAQATSQQRAGDREATQSMAAEVEQLLLQEIKASPLDAELRWQLARLYQTKAFGPDDEKAWQAIVAARNLDPGHDPARTQAIHCLYRQGRYADAWAMWSAAMRDGRKECSEEPTLFYAGISAHRCGQTESGQRLLRQAAFRYPTNPLCQENRELIHERP